MFNRTVVHQRCFSICNHSPRQWSSDGQAHLRWKSEDQDQIAAYSKSDLVRLRQCRSSTVQGTRKRLTVLRQTAVLVDCLVRQTAESHITVCTKLFRPPKHRSEIKYSVL